MPQRSAPTLECTNAIVADDSRFMFHTAGSVRAECSVYPAIPRDQNIIVVDLMALRKGLWQTCVRSMHVRVNQDSAGRTPILQRLYCAISIRLLNVHPLPDQCHLPARLSNTVVWSPLYGCHYAT